MNKTWMEGETNKEGNKRKWNRQTMNTWKRPMVVVGLGDGQGEVKGEVWWDPVGVLWGSPSTTSPLCPPPPLRGDEESLCKVFSGLERLEDDEEDEVEEVVEEDSVQAGRWSAGSSAADTWARRHRHIRSANTFWYIVITEKKSSSGLWTSQKINQFCLVLKNS